MINFRFVFGKSKSRQTAFRTTLELSDSVRITSASVMLFDRVLGKYSDKKSRFSTQLYIKIIFILSIVSTSTVMLQEVLVAGIPSVLFQQKMLVNDKLPLFHWKKNGARENFGDRLSPTLVQSIIGPSFKLVTITNRVNNYCKSPKLLGIGSIIQFVCNQDVIWGSGILNPVTFPRHLDLNVMKTVDIRAVRGPRTRHFLISRFNVSVPEVYGDPALLLPYFLPRYKKVANPTIPILVILHYKDISKVKITDQNASLTIINALLPWHEVVNMILDSNFVISTSLHGIIVAEAFGVPARVWRSPRVDLFKFHDYFEGTGRRLRYAKTIPDAIAMGGEIPPTVDLKKLRDAFPFDKYINISSEK